MNFSITFSVSAKKGSQDFGSNFIDSVDKSEDYCLLKTEKAMATHSSILAWKIPRAEEPGGLRSMATQTVKRD